MTTPMFDELVRTYSGWLVRYLSTRVRRGDGDLADDLAQVAFLRAWRALPAARLESAPQQRAWLATIARHVLADHYRSCATLQRLREQQTDPTDRLAWPISAVGDGADWMCAAVDVARSMTAAPAERRRLVALRLVDQAPWALLAGTTGHGKAVVRRLVAETTAGVLG